MTIRWDERGLDDARLRIVLSLDRGRTWRTIGRVVSRRRAFSWRVEGQWGVARVRIESADGRRRLAERRVRVVAPVRDVQAGVSFGVALHEDGRVRVWGLIGNYFGYLPEIRHHALYRRPRILDLLDGITSMSVDDQTAMFTRSDGSVWMWGPFSSRGLGVRRVDGVSNAIWARTGTHGSFVRLADGRVLGFGQNPWGLFAETDVGEHTEEIPELWDAVDISLGGDHGLALMPDGSVLSFGSNVYGQLGDDTVGVRVRPARVGLGDVAAIDASLDTSLVLRKDGTVWIWGFGLFLLDTEVNHGATATPTEVPGLADITAISDGGLGGVALRSDGALFVWGLNPNHEYLAEGGETIPVATRAPQVPALGRLWPVPGGVQAITLSGERIGWGRNEGYSLGDGTRRPRFIPVPIRSE